MTAKKEKGSATRKPDDPRRSTEAKRQLNFNGIKIRNQRLIWRFDKDNRGLSFDECGSILLFVLWLQKNKYFIRRKNGR